jgi:hypothetical protein
MLPLDPPTIPLKHKHKNKNKNKNKNKKCPAPPQLSHGLKPPHKSQSEKQAPSKLSGVPIVKDMLAQMNSHDLKSLLFGKLMDTGLLFEQLQQNAAGHEDMNSDAKETLFPGGPQGEEEVDNPFCTPFANQGPLIQPAP